MRGTFKKPALQPIKQPPGNVSLLGKLCIPPSLIARAPYAIRVAPSNTPRTFGCVLKR